MTTITTDKPVTGTLSAIQLEDMYQVILHNDDVNVADFVARCLMRVFGHTEQLAYRIMMEAHNKGRAIAQVEAESEARLHRGQLQSFGLTATIEKV